MRRLSREIKDAMRQRAVRLALFAEIDHPDGMVNVWTGIGTIEHGGKSWQGIGALGTIQGVEKSSELQILEHVYTLHYVPPTDTDFVNSPVRGRRAMAWIGFLSEANQVIDDLVLIAETTLDVTRLSIDQNGAETLSLVGQNDLFQLERPLAIGLSDTEQRKRFPDDTGFSEVVPITTQRLAWTRV